jgi:hypothetical protein
MRLTKRGHRLVGFVSVAIFLAAWSHLEWIAALTP